MRIRENFGLTILLSVLFGFLLPGPGLFLQSYLQYLLMLLMFISCLKIPLKELLKFFKEIKNLSVMLLLIHLLPALIALLFKPLLSTELFLGLIIVAAAPSGLSVVFLCHLCKGRPAQALSLTSVSNLLSPLIMPLLVIFFAGAAVKISAYSMFWLIIKIIIIPYTAAQIVDLLPGKETIDVVGKKISVPLLVAIIWAITAPTRQMMFNNPTEAVLLFVIVSTMILAGFFTGWWLGREHRESVTYGRAGSYKNFTLATVIALTLFDPVVALPSVIYTIANNVWLGPMHFFFEWRHHKAEAGSSKKAEWFFL